MPTAPLTPKRTYELAELVGTIRAVAWRRHDAAVRSQRPWSRLPERALRPVMQDKKLGLVESLIAEADESSITVLGALGPALDGTDQLLCVLQFMLDNLDNSDSGIRATMSKIGATFAAAADTGAVLNVLLGLFDDDDDLKRRFAVTTLAHLAPAVVGSPDASRAVQALIARIDTGDDDNYTREVAADTLGEFGPAVTAVGREADAVGALIRAYSREDTGLRDAIVRALGKLGLTVVAAAALRAVLGALDQALRDPEWQVCESSARALGKLGAERLAREQRERLTTWLVSMLDSKDSYLRCAALVALCELGPALGKCGQAANVARALLRELETDNDFQRVLAAKALGKLGPALAATEELNAVSRMLTSRLGAKHWHIREVAATALAEVASELPAGDELSRVADQLLGIALSDRAHQARFASATALGKLEPALQAGGHLPRLARGLLNGLYAEERQTRLDAELVLAELSPVLLEMLGSTVGDIIDSFVGDDSLYINRIETVARLCTPIATTRKASTFVGWLLDQLDYSETEWVLKYSEAALDRITTGAQVRFRVRGRRTPGAHPTRTVEVFPADQGPISLVRAAESGSRA